MLYCCWLPVVVVLLAVPLVPVAGDGFFGVVFFLVVVAAFLFSLSSTITFFVVVDWAGAGAL